MGPATTATANLSLPANASMFTRVRLALRALEVLKDDPGNPHYGPLLNACMDSGTYAKLAGLWRTSREGERLLAETMHWSRGQGATHVEVAVHAFNGEARRFYERFGFARSIDRLMMAA